MDKNKIPETALMLIRMFWNVTFEGGNDKVFEQALQERWGTIKGAKKCALIHCDLAMGRDKMIFDALDLDITVDTDYWSDLKKAITAL